MAKNTVVLEEQKKFSESMLWQWQRNYYDSEGIDAWTSNVPFYITSNPFIGKCYANIVVRFIQDWLREHPDAINQTFYIMELGVGPGQFSYYVMKQLDYLLTKLKMQQVKLCYIMTDFTENNVKFWQQHAALKPYVDRGVLDFAVFDVENDSTVHLIAKDVNLGPGDFKNPLVVFANYLFDSIINDIIAIKDHQLFESLVTLKTTEENVRDGQPISGEEVTIEYTDRPITVGYYPDAEIDEVLQNHKDDFTNARIMFPVACLRAISRLRKLSDDRLMLISTDKGNAANEELEDDMEPELDFHGSFSVMVNYNAVARYFRLQGGDCYMQNHRDAIITNVFSLGFKLRDGAELPLAMNQFIKGFSPADYFNFYEHIDENLKKANLDMIASLLNLSSWDPGIFDIASDRISDLIEETDEEIVDYLAANVHQVADNFYYVPGSNDVLFDVGVFYHELGDFDKAINYYTLSREYFPEGWEVLFNQACCLFEVGQYKEALVLFQQSLDHECDRGDRRETDKWIAKAKSKV